MPDDMPEGYPFKLPTPASTVIARFGFSQKEAAAFYGVRLDTIKKWISGKMEMPDDLLLESYVKLDALSDGLDAPPAGLYLNRSDPEGLRIGRIR